MTKYKLEDKVAAVIGYLEGAESFVSIGKSIGTSESVFMNWVKQHKSHKEINLYEVEVIFLKKAEGFLTRWKIYRMEHVKLISN